MMKKQVLIATLTVMLGASVSFATPIAPHYNDFNNLLGATYGGSGIPTDPSAITKISDHGNTITLGLIAHQRYSNPPLGNDGSGTFFATPGLNDGLEGQSIGTTWNFGLYIDVDAKDSNTEAYSFKLVYGNNTTDTFSTLSLGVPSALSGNFQDSWNLNMSFLNTIGFDANATDQYAFELLAFDSSGAEIGSSAINVNVDSVPDTGSSLALMGLAFAGIVGLRRKLNI